MICFFVLFIWDLINVKLKKKDYECVVKLMNGIKIINIFEKIKVN